MPPIIVDPRAYGKRAVEIIRDSRVAPEMAGAIERAFPGAGDGVAGSVTAGAVTVDGASVGGVAVVIPFQKLVAGIVNDQPTVSEPKSDQSDAESVAADMMAELDEPPRAFADKPAGSTLDAIGHAGWKLFGLIAPDIVFALEEKDAKMAIQNAFLDPAPDARTRAYVNAGLMYARHGDLEMAEQQFQAVKEEYRFSADACLYLVEGIVFALSIAEQGPIQGRPGGLTDRQKLFREKMRSLFRSIMLRHVTPSPFFIDKVYKSVVDRWYKIAQALHKAGFDSDARELLAAISVYSDIAAESNVPNEVTELFQGMAKRLYAEASGDTVDLEGRFLEEKEAVKKTLLADWIWFRKVAEPELPKELLPVKAYCDAGKKFVSEQGERRAREQFDMALATALAVKEPASTTIVLEYSRLRKTDALALVVKNVAGASRDNPWFRGEAEAFFKSMISTLTDPKNGLPDHEDQLRLWFAVSNELMRGGFFYEGSTLVAIVGAYNDAMNGQFADDDVPWNRWNFTVVLQFAFASKALEKAGGENRPAELEQAKLVARNTYLKDWVLEKFAFPPQVLSGPMMVQGSLSTCIGLWADIMTVPLLVSAVLVVSILWHHIRRDRLGMEQILEEPTPEQNGPQYYQGKISKAVTSAESLAGAGRFKKAIAQYKNALSYADGLREHMGTEEWLAVLTDIARSISENMPTGGSAKNRFGEDVRHLFGRILWMIMGLPEILELREPMNGIFEAIAKAGYVGEVEDLLGKWLAALKEYQNERADTSLRPVLERDWKSIRSMLVYVVRRYDPKVDAHNDLSVMQKIFEIERETKEEWDALKASHDEWYKEFEREYARVSQKDEIGE